MQGRHRKPVTRRCKRALNRFTLLGLGLALALAILGWQVHEAGYAHASKNAGGHTRVCWGANAKAWPAFHQAVPDSGCERVYYDGINVIPATWPKSDAREMISIRPDPSDLLSHKLDAQLRAFIASAPPGSQLTAFHENAGGNPLGYSPEIHNAATYVKVQRYLENLCQGTNVRFGVIIIAPFGSVLSWIYKGDDWFGVDLYAFDRYLSNSPMAAAQGASFTTAAGTINTGAVEARLTANLRAVQRFTGKRYPLMEIGETGTSKDSQRITWFATLAWWWDHYDGHRGGVIDTRWVPDNAPDNSHLTGPWPPSAGVVAELKHLAWEQR